MLEKTISRDGFSTVPSRFTSLIFHTQSESGAYTHGLMSFLRLSALASISTARRHRASAELIEPRKCVPMAFTAERTRAIFFTFTASGPQRYNCHLPATTEGSSHLSPVLAFRILIALQVQHSYKLVNRWLKFLLVYAYSAGNPINQFLFDSTNTR